MTYRRCTMLLLLLAALGSCAIGVVIRKYSVQIPFQDDWEFAKIYLAIKNGTLRLSDLVTYQHNEHKIFVPLAIMAANAWLLNWNILVNLYLSLSFAFATALLLIYVARRTIVDDPLLYLVVGIFIIAQVFSMSQYINWIWEWDMSWYILNLCIATMAACLVAASDDDKHATMLISVAIAAGVIGEFTVAAGLVLLPFGLAFVATSSKIAKYRLYWMAALVVGYVTFFSGYTFVEHITPPMPWPARILASIEFVGRYLGQTIWSGYAVGFVVIALAIIGSVFAFYSQSKISKIWIFLSAIPCAAGALAAISRVPLLGPAEGSSTRYGTLALIFPVAVVSLIAIALPATMRRAKIAAVTTLVVLTVVHYPQGYNDLLRWGYERLLADEKCLYGQPTTACLDDVYVAGASELTLRR
jgi:hypothetical protein